MSQDSPEDISVTEAGVGAGTGSPQGPPQWNPNGMSDLADGSGLIFSMYLERAEEEDKKMAENWKENAEGTLVFAGLFSAAVASLISISIQDIRPNPQDTSNFYLANIYQTIADPNRSNISSSLPSSPPQFSPPNYAVWVNALWFMSLVISISCALLATLLQQWARKYLRVTQPRYSGLLERARIRTFFSKGVEGCLLPWAVEALPTLLHVSLFLFFAGLVVFLRNINLPIFKSVLSWVGVCTALYGCVTWMPVLRRDSPYHTPLSPVARAIAVAFLAWSLQWVFGLILTYHLFRCLIRRERFPSDRLLGSLGDKIWEWATRLLKNTEKIILQSPSGLDARAFMWTFDSLNEDHELAHFFSGLPSFRSSKVVDDPLPSLAPEEKKKLSMALIGLLDRTLSSNLLKEEDKKRRAMICAKATDPAHIPKTFDILYKIWTRYRYTGPLATDIAQIARGWGSITDELATWDARASISMIIAITQPRDDSWFTLASGSNALGVPESVLRDYAANGDSLSLAVLIHVTRQQLDRLGEDPWPYDWFAQVLKAASSYNIQNSTPELQHKFCVLWNQIVLKAQTSTVNPKATAWHILRPIRNTYIALHQDTDSAPTRFSSSTGDGDEILLDPFSYPVCTVPGHVHNDSPSTSSVRAAALAHVSLASSDVPSSPVPAPLHVDKSLTNVPPLENFHGTHQTTTHSLPIRVTSQDLTTTRDFVTSGVTTPTPQTVIPTPALSSTSPLATVSLQHNPDLLTRTLSDPPNLPHSASSIPVIGNIVPTNPLLSSHSHITRSNLSPSCLSCLESHRSESITVATSSSPSASTGPISAEGDDSPPLSSRKEKDSLESPSVDQEVHANTIATLPYFPPRFPLVFDSKIATVTAGRSPEELNPECMGDHPPHLSRFPYDMV